MKGRITSKSATPSAQREGKPIRSVMGAIRKKAAPVRIPGNRWSAMERHSEYCSELLVDVAYEISVGRDFAALT